MFDKKLLKRMAEIVDLHISGAEEFHLGSIAKASEFNKNCRIFLNPFPKASLKGPLGCLMTVNSRIVYHQETKEEPESLSSRDHFIFFRKNKKDPESERWGIAHEIGHIILHWPLKSRRKRMIPTAVSGTLKGYMITFDEKEEREANALACLLTSHRPKPNHPERKNKVIFDEKLFSDIQKYFDKGYFSPS